MTGVLKGSLSTRLSLSSLSREKPLTTLLLHPRPHLSSRLLRQQRRCQAAPAIAAEPPSTGPQAEPDWDGDGITGRPQALRDAMAEEMRREDLFSSWAKKSRISSAYKVGKGLLEN